MNRPIMAAALAALAAWLAAPPLARALPPVLAVEHVDVGLGYEDDAWDLHVHDEDNDVEYESDEPILFGGPNTLTSQPVDPAFAFTGAAPGDDLWVLPEVQEPNKIWLGFGAEETASGTFDNYLETDPRIAAADEWVKVQLVAVRGPGQVSLFQVDQFGLPVLWMSTADGLDATDVTFVPAEGERHLNWAFTAPGCYELDFVASAFLNGVPVVSDPATYRLGIECVPEPSSLILAGCGAVALAWAARVRGRTRRAS